MSSLSKVKSSLKKLKQVNTVTETMKIDDIEFEITVLTRNEEIQAQAWADQSVDGLSHVLMMDVARLSFAIKKIDGINMEEYVEDPDTGDRMQRNIFLREELMNLPSPLLDALISKYNSVRAKLREKLGMSKLSLDSIVEQAQKIESQAQELEQATKEGRAAIDEIDKVLETSEGNLSE